MEDGSDSPEGCGGAGRRKRKWRRSRLLVVRLAADEKRALNAIRESTGLTTGALLRHALLGVPPPPDERQPSAETDAANQLRGHLGKIGGNIRQLAKPAHIERFDSATCESVEYGLRNIMELRQLCMKRLGFENGLNPDAGEHPP